MTPSKIAVCVLLGVAFASSMFLIYVIVFRLRSHLISKSYRAILVSKVCWALLTGSAVYLVIWPLPYRVAIIQLAWFSVLAVGTFTSALGFWLYSKDVKIILESDNFVSELPVKPSNGQVSIPVSSKIEVKEHE